ncbi:oxygenase MpaB family protein [Parafrigoribacterium mesophilum]|uniref:oxygenase MpaB family protein n=1 Tax=Parafrigoribacterium mesophilum TaxID=433646 RepID=UPI0031FE0E33
MTKHLADITGEAVLLAGGARAILLQIANPSVGRGVAEHSRFATDPLLRLRNTLTYVYVVSCGTPHDIEAVAHAVHRAHSPVRGAQYDASDPNLQLWVAATLYDTATLVYQQIFGMLAPEDADSIYQDYAALGTVLGMPHELWPADRTAFRAYWDDAVTHLAVDQKTLQVAGELLHPQRVPLWLRAVMPLAQLVTVGLLTTDQRALYGLPWNIRRQRRFDRAMAVAAAVYPRLPKRIRHWPRNHYLHRFGALPG